MESLTSSSEGDFPALGITKSHFSAPMAARGTWQPTQLFLKIPTFQALPDYIST